jgi:hypothetical protein
MFTRRYDIVYDISEMVCYTLLLASLPNEPGEDGTEGGQTIIDGERTDVGDSISSLLHAAGKVEVVGPFIFMAL